MSVITPRLLNEARFGYTRVANQVNQEGQGISINRQVGLPELSTNPRDWGLSFITVTGYSPLGQEYNNPQKGITDAFQFVDTITWSPGAHLVKGGFDLRTVRQDAFRDVQARGQLAFTPFAYTGNGLADLLLGLPTITVGAALDNPQRLRTENVGLFVQDQWRATSTLTLTAGVRYELTSAPVDATDRATIYDQSTGTLVAVGTGGVPRAGYESDRNNFAPRLGFAWSATPETVVRGAYGIYYNQSALAPSEGLYFSDPYLHLDFFFPAQGLPPLTLYDPFPANYPIPSPQSGFTFQRDLKTPYLQHFSVGVQRQLGATRSVEAAYVGSRGSSLVAGARPQPAAPEHDVAEPASESVLRRHHDPRVGRPLRVQQPAAQVRAAQRKGRLGAGCLHAGQVRRRCVGVLPERRRSELPAGQPEPRGRVRAFELRRAAPLLGRRCVGRALRRGAQRRAGRVAV